MAGNLLLGEDHGSIGSNSEMVPGRGCEGFLYGNCIPKDLSDSGLVYDSAEWAGGISRPAGALVGGRRRDPDGVQKQDGN